MKKTILLLIGLSFCIAGFTQERDTIRRWLDDNLRLVNRSQAVFAGLQVKSDDHWLVVVVYPDTGLLLKAYYKDRNLRIKDGPFTLYHPKGIKAIQGTYAENTKQGVWRYWYENGQLKDSGQIKYNQMTGTWLSWTDSGQLLTKGVYTNEILDHTTPVYTEGKSLIYDEEIFRQRDGLWEVYYNNGKLKESGNYKKEKKEGPWKNWYESGKLEAEGQFTANNQEGEWNFYRENGQLSTREQYKNNKVVSLECFDESGKPTGDFCSLSKPAVAALDRYTDFKTYMLDHIFWPKELEGRDVNGIVKVSLTISKEGKMTHIEVLESPHELLSKETLRFFDTVKSWYPAISHNRPVEYTTTLEIPFVR